MADLVTGIIADLGIDMQGMLSRLLLQNLVTIGPDRAETRQVTRSIFRAERSGQHRWAVVLEGDGNAVESPTIESTFGCILGEVVTVPERRLTVAELIAPRALQRGDLFSCENVVSWPASGGVPSHRNERAILEPMRSLELGVRFHPDTRPVDVHAGFRSEMGVPGSGPAERIDVDLSNHEAQFVRLDAKPGVYGLYWSWE